MMSNQTLIRETVERPRAPWLRNAAGGAGWGGVLALVCLGVGALRILAALVFGAHVALPTVADLRLLAFYVGGFSVAGALLGVARPLLRTRRTSYVGCACAGALAMIVIGVGDKGSLRALD